MAFKHSKHSAGFIWRIDLVKDLVDKFAFCFPEKTKQGLDDCLSACSHLNKF